MAVISTIIGILLMLLGLVYIAYKKLVSIITDVFSKSYSAPKKTTKEEEYEEIQKTLLDQKKEIEGKKFDTIIIGGGMSGLASAGYLAKGFGHKVLVLEAHPETLGGNTHTFKQNEFEFPSGLHFLYGEKDEGYIQSPLKLLNFLSDGELKYKCEKDAKLIIHDQKGKDYDIPLDADQQKAKLIELFPEEKQGIENFYEYAFKRHKEVDNWIVLRTLPLFLAKIFKFLGFAKDVIKAINEETLQDVLDRFIKNKKLQNLLSTQLMYNGMNAKEISFPFYTLFFCSLQERSFPIEGASMIARKVVKVIKKYKGICACNARVERIITKRKNGKETAIGIEVREGSRTNGEKFKIYGTNIISSAGIEITYTKLLSKKSQAKFPIELKEKLSTIKQEDSLTAFSAFLGFDNSDGRMESEFPTNKEIFFKNLQISSDEYTEMIEKHDKFDPKKMELSFAIFPSLYNLDEKKVGASMFIFTNRKWFEKYANSKVNQRGKDYEELKDELLDYGLDCFFKKYPQLKDRLIHTSTASPLTNVHYCSTPRGSFYGHKFVTKRVNEFKSAVSHINNLYLTGSDTLFPGVGSQLLSGMFTVSEIVKKNLLVSLTITMNNEAKEKLEKEKSKKVKAL